MKRILFSILYPNKEEIPFLNGIRAFAIFFVILHHYWDHSGLFPPHSIYIPKIMKNLSIGVDLFFVLSGYLIYSILQNEYQQTGKIHFFSFFRNRFLRIFPAYYVFLGISYILFKGMLKGIPIGTPEYANTLQWFQNLRFDFFYLGNYFGSSQAHLWSLAIEEQFYCILPFLSVFVLFKISPTQRLIFILTLWFSILGGRLFLYQSIQPNTKELFDTWFYVPLHTRGDGLLTGILARELIHEWNVLEKFQSKFYKLFLQMGILILLPICMLFTLQDSFFWYSTFRFSFVNLLLLGIFLYTHIKGSIFNRFFSLPMFTPFAKLSYGMYLWHIIGGAWGFSILLKMKPNFHWGEVFLGFCGVFGGAVLFSLVNYFLIEYPFLQWKKKTRVSSSQVEST